MVVLVLRSHFCCGLEQNEILRELPQKGRGRGPTRKVTCEDVQEIQDMMENDRINAYKWHGAPPKADVP